MRRRAVGVVGEHGREHVVVGEVAAAVVRVVGDEHVALAELVDAEELEREAHRQRRREHELRDADRQRGEAARARRGSVALRSFDWLRIGVVAVRETYFAISKHTVSMPPRMTSAVTGIDAVGRRRCGRGCPASRTRSTFVMTAAPIGVPNLT